MINVSRQNKKQSYSLLVIDDHEDNRLVIELMLNGSVWQVTTAIDGKSGLDLFMKQNFDIILLDIQMPEMDGFEVIEAMRTWEQKNSKRRTPIIAFTAYSTQEEQSKPEFHHFDGMLTKPLSKDGLLKTINPYI